MKTRKSERGQAFAEYMPLIPPVLLLSVLILVPLAENSSDIFCRMVNAMEPERCEVITVDEEEQLPEEEPDDCIPLQESEGGSQCDQSSVCTKFDLPGPSVWNPTVPIQTVVVKAGQGYFKFNETTNDGCYNISIDTDPYQIRWEKVGHGSNCKDISHVQAWEALVCE